ncbi:MAG TPA: hypothetical protein VGT03_13595 [Candidatus Acidoferrales bacterium]|nr:hypothetical protein [Candidatus Acidoferrales bacterium]
MIHTETKPPSPEPVEGRPVASGDEWLGKNAGARRRLWEHLNPRHRRELRVLARAFVLRQAKERIPESLRQQFFSALDELERLTRRIEQLFVKLGKPPY